MLPVAVAIVAAVLVILYFVAGTTWPAGNERIERQESLGSSAFVSDKSTYRERHGMDAVLSGKPDGTAKWILASNDFPGMLSTSLDCRLRVYVAGSDPVPYSDDGRITLLMNGKTLRTLQLAGQGSKSVTPFRHAFSTQPVFISPLFQPPALVAEVPQSDCNDKRWMVQIALHNASWRIDRVGLIATYVPRRPTISLFDLVSGLFLCSALFCGLALSFATLYRRHGILALCVALAIPIGAFLTHDEWDFPIWLRFVDLAAFGQADPALMWAGTPLWPLLTSMAAPVLRLTYAAFGNGSQEISALFIKLLLSVAFLWAAIGTGKIAGRQSRLFTFAALLSPIALFGLAAGYREILAGALSVVGLQLCIRQRTLAAALVLALGASISEALLPLMMLPAALDLVSSRRNRTRILTAVASTLIPIMIIVFFWKLIPTAVAQSALSSRTSGYRFGGASWQGALDALGIQMSWFRTNGFVATLSVFAFLSAPLLYRYVKLFFSEERDSLKDVFLIFLGLELCFFLSYPGVDPSTWVALGMIVLPMFAVIDRTNPYPLLLCALCGLAFYAAVGLGDFMNWTYLWPMDVGLFGTLGRQTYALMLGANFVIFAGWFGSVTGVRKLSSKQSLLAATSFLAAALLTTIYQFTPDLLVLGSTGVMAAIVFKSMTGARPRFESSSQANRAAMIILAVACVFVLRDWRGVLLASGCGFLAFCDEVALLDVALSAGALVQVASAVGSGWLTYFGVAGLIFVIGAARPSLTANCLRYGGFLVRLFGFDVMGRRRRGLVAIGRHPVISPEIHLNFGSNVWVGSHAVFQGQGVFVIGDDTYIGSFFTGNCTSKITIGSSCMLGNGVSLVDNNHGIEVATEMRLQPLRSAPIVIERNCWVAEKATILAGVTIGTGAIVAAGAVVTRDVPAYAIVAGVPATIQRFRPGAPE
ncbi:MAG: acyltransferase, partial [Candidatus Eremiobacteraeota bacterium]|nr:acyltransferase [Candidatus Eremiobacteraeota bacterium]